MGVAAAEQYESFHFGCRMCPRMSQISADETGCVSPRAGRTPALRAKLIEQGYEPVGSTSAELVAVQATDLKRWEGPIKATGVQLD